CSPCPTAASWMSGPPAPNETSLDPDPRGAGSAAPAASRGLVLRTIYRGNQGRIARGFSHQAHVELPMAAATRACRKGDLKLSLVTCPIAPRARRRGPGENRTHQPRACDGDPSERSCSEPSCVTTMRREGARRSVESPKIPKETLSLASHILNTKAGHFEPLE